MRHLLFREIQRIPIAGRLVGCRTQCWPVSKHRISRCFHASPTSHRVIPYVLADIGEGITECQIISWSVKPGDRVQQFDNICEVQSDKASVEITSRFDGTITALHYDVSDMAIVGQPFVDIDVDDDVLEELNQTPQSDQENAGLLEHTPVAAFNEAQQNSTSHEDRTSSEVDDQSNKIPIFSSSNVNSSAKQAHLVTPAVRHMLKTHNIAISDVQGTGRDGRILKDDVLRHISTLPSTPPSSSGASSQVAAADQPVTLSPIETRMFNIMTRSLNIPHFLYTHAVDFTSLNTLRKRLNIAENQFPIFSESDQPRPKLTPLPFIMKAVSLAFLQFPKLNSHLDIDAGSDKHRLLIKASHDFGIAVDTPQGLLVPVVRDVQNHSIASLAKEINRISRLAKDGKLAPSDFKGATFTISNIGSIGGSVVGPVIVEPMVGILGVGQVRAVPAFQTDERGVEIVVKREEAVCSWSADHRVIDGATVARCARAVQELLENFELVSTTLK